jgi:hypothetical protein
MDQSFRTKLLQISNGKPNKLSPIELIEVELKNKSQEIGKSSSHPITWEKNVQKIRKNSVSIYFLFNYQQVIMFIIIGK